MIGRKSKELSPNMKEVIIKLILKGMRNSDISRMFEVSKSTCRSVIKVFRKWVASKRQKKIFAVRKIVQSRRSKITSVGETEQRKTIKILNDIPRKRGNKHFTHSMLNM